MQTQKPKITYHFDDISDVVKQSIQEIYVPERVDTMRNSYLKPFLDKDDAAIEFKISLGHHKGVYSGSFQFLLDGKSFVYQRDSFENLRDLINHAFAHLEEQLGKK